MKWIRSIINLIPAIIGTVQVALPIAKELIVDIARIVALIPGLSNLAERIIVLTNKVYGTINDAIENLKNLLLFIPK